MQLTPDLSRIAELEADNRRLRRLLDQRDAPAELRHRLRGTLALLRAVIQRSTGGRADVQAYAAHLEDRLVSMMRIQSHIDLEGEVDLSTLIAEELFAYDTHEGRKLRLAGPPVRLQARAGHSLGLAVHELAVNAVEHGALPTPAGRIDVTWRVDGDGPAPVLALDWKETGSKGVGEPSRRGFGTEVLTSMLRHELEAETVFSHEPDGVRWSMRFPFPPRVGRLAEIAPPVGGGASPGTDADRL